MKFSTQISPLLAFDAIDLAFGLDPCQKYDKCKANLDHFSQAYRVIKNAIGLSARSRAPNCEKMNVPNSISFL